MEKYVSLLNFNNYSIEDFQYKKNQNFIQEDNGIELKYNFHADAKFTEDKSKANILLVCEIFDEETFNSSNSPFYLKMEIMGYFNCEPGVEIEHFELNGIAILLPYLRSLITSFTAQAGIPPVIIPPINVYSMIENQNDEM